MPEELEQLRAIHAAELVFLRARQAHEIQELQRTLAGRAWRDLKNSEARQGGFTLEDLVPSM